MGRKSRGWWATVGSLALVVGLATGAPAQEGKLYGPTARPFGLGIIAGEPTGLSLKWYLSQNTAVDGAVAWSVASGDFHLHGDYLLHRGGLIRVQHGELPVFFGVGGRIRFRDGRDDDIGVRIPLGILYRPEGMPLDAFIEVVPILNLLPGTDLYLNAAIGGRFYF